MNKFEQKPNEIIKSGETIYSKKIEDVALRAVEIQEFQDAVKKATSRLKATMAVRALLQEYFPEISKMPKPRRPDKPINKQSAPIRTNRIGPPASNDYMIAKNVVDLLYEKQ